MPGHVAKRAEDDILEITEFEKFDASLKRLIGHYRAVVESSRQVPKFSVMGAIDFWKKAIWWEINLFFVLFVLWVNLTIHICNLIFSTSFRSRGSRAINTFISPFICLHNGEISAFKLITLQGVVRLLVYYRFSGMLAAILVRLQAAKVKGFEDAETVAFDARWYEQRIALIRDFKDVIGDKLGYAFWSSLTGVSVVFGILKQAH